MGSCRFKWRNVVGLNNFKDHHHHVQEGLGLNPVPCILKMELVPPSLPRSSYVSSSFWFILQCLFRYPVCVHPLYVLQPLFLVLFYFLYYILYSRFFHNTLVFFLYLVLLFQLGVSKILSVLRMERVWDRIITPVVLLACICDLLIFPTYMNDRSCCITCVQLIKT